jgi:hypothetical protein
VRLSLLGAPIDPSPEAARWIARATLRREFHMSTTDLRRASRREVRALLAVLKGVGEATREKERQAKRPR